MEPDNSSGQPMPLVSARPNHIGMNVADLDAQQIWYGKVFGLRELMSHQPLPNLRTVLLRAPDGLQLELIAYSEHIASTISIRPSLRPWSKDTDIGQSTSMTSQMHMVACWLRARNQRKSLLSVQRDVYSLT